MTDVCGHQHPGYEHTCTFPKGHDRVMPEDCELPEELMDHGDPARGAWWSVSPAVVSSGLDIPDEAVEAWCEAAWSDYATMTEGWKNVHRLIARRGLAAAYPALTRQAVAADRVRWLNVTDAVAAERERIATAIEAERDRQPSLTPSAHLNGYTQAARIARAGGTP